MIFYLIYVTWICIHHINTSVSWCGCDLHRSQISILWQIFRYAISTGCGWVMTGESLSRIWPLCCGVGNEIVFFGDTSPNNLNLIGDVFVNWFPPFFFALPHTGLGTRCWETFLFKENHIPIRPPFVNNGKRIDPLLHRRSPGQHRPHRVAQTTRRQRSLRTLRHSVALLYGQLLGPLQRRLQSTGMR